MRCAINYTIKIRCATIAAIKIRHTMINTLKIRCQINNAMRNIDIQQLPPKCDKKYDK